MSNKRENISIKEKEEKNKNLLFIKLVLFACLFLLGVIYASKIKAILYSKNCTSVYSVCD